MIDLHCHILPGVDDGPSEIAESLAMARAFAADGVDMVVATPHLRDDHPGVVPLELAGRCEELNRFLREEGVSVQVVSGGEVDLLWAQSATPETLVLASYGQRGTDLLLETPYGPLPPSFERLLFRLTASGFRLLLAHPERNPTFQRDPARLGELVRTGVLVQVTASSLVSSDRRSRSARLARALVEDGVAHVIASDSHSPEGPKRATLSEGVAAAAELAPRRSLWMATAAPAAILSGKPLPPPPVDRPSLSRRLRQKLAGTPDPPASA